MANSKRITWDELVSTYLRTRDEMYVWRDKAQRSESECGRLRGLVEGGYEEGWLAGEDSGQKQRPPYGSSGEDWCDSEAKGLLEGPQDPEGAE